jgi:hypothetical protein
MAYGQVKLEALGDVGREYEDPDKLQLARSGRGGGGRGNYVRTNRMYNSLLVNHLEAPVYAIQQ